MLRTIKYVLDTKNYGLVLRPTIKEDMKFVLKGLSDSEFAGNRDTRISTYGFILYLCGAPISWKSKTGRSVTLSSCEAEYVGLSELAKEVIFAKQVLESMGFNVEYPIIIHVDNIGAIYLANNHCASQRTKHVDTRFHFVREFVEDGILKIVFVRSEENDADIFTKNTSQEIFIKHATKNREEVPNLD